MKKIKDDRKIFFRRTELLSKKLGENKKYLKQSIQLKTALNNYDYPYLWRWLGVPIIQLPSDILVTQEVLFNVKPDVIIETGIARGGSLIFYASLMSLIKKKFKIIGIDIDLRSHNKKTIFKSKFSKNIRIVNGSSTDQKILKKITKLINKKDKVLVILDSDHSKDHVRKECDLYSKLVTKNSYLIVADTILGFMNKSQTPRRRSKIWYKGNEPMSAAKKFLKENKNFIIDKTLNGKLIFSSSYNGYLKKIK